MSTEAGQPSRQNRYFLKELYSFMSATAVDKKLIRKLDIADDERLAGIYFNDETDFIVFTQKAFYWVRKDREIVCPYETIDIVKLPAREEDVNDEREIEVALKNGDFLFLPVINDTDGYLDIYCVAEVLQSWVSSATNVQSLTDLISRLKSAVSEYKLYPSSWSQPMPVDYFETLIIYLDKCLGDCLNGESHIRSSANDFVSLDQPKTWRLISEILLAPQTFTIDQ